MEKGHTNNPNGRPKGSPNKVTSELKERLKELIEGHFDQIEADLKTIDPEARIKLLFSILPYIIPKQQTISEKAQIEMANKEWNENEERIHREEIRSCLKKMFNDDSQD